MIVGSASRFLGGRGAIQTVYWRVSKKDQKLVKIGKNFNLQKPTYDESAGVQARFSEIRSASKTEGVNFS